MGRKEVWTQTLHNPDPLVDVEFSKVAILFWCRRRENSETSTVFVDKKSLPPPPPSAQQHVPKFPFLETSQADSHFLSSATHKTTMKLFPFKFQYQQSQHFPTALPIDQCPMKTLNSIFYSHLRETRARRIKHVGTIGYGRWLGSHRQPGREPALAPARLLPSFLHTITSSPSFMAWLGRSRVSRPPGSPRPIALWCSSVPSVLIQGNAPGPTSLRLLPTRHPKQPWGETGTCPFHWAELQPDPRLFVFAHTCISVYYCHAPREGQRWLRVFTIKRWNYLKTSRWVGLLVFRKFSGEKRVVADKCLFN